MSLTPHDGAGTGFTFSGGSYLVTSITWSSNEVTSAAADTIDVSHLGLVNGDNVLTIPRPLIAAASAGTGGEVSIDYIGSAPISAGTSGAITISGGMALSAAGATCTQSSVTAKVNDVITGTATFKF